MLPICAIFLAILHSFLQSSTASRGGLECLHPAQPIASYNQSSTTCWQNDLLDQNIEDGWHHHLPRPTPLPLPLPPILHTPLLLSFSLKQCIFHNSCEHRHRSGWAGESGEITLPLVLHHQEQDKQGSVFLPVKRISCATAHTLFLHRYLFSVNITLYVIDIFM